MSAQSASGLLDLVLLRVTDVKQGPVPLKQLIVSISSFNAFSSLNSRSTQRTCLTSAHHKITGSVYLLQTPTVMVSRLDDPSHNPLRRSDSPRRLRESNGKTICNYQNNNEIYEDYVNLEKSIDEEYLIHNISLV